MNNLIVGHNIAIGDKIKGGKFFYMLISKHNIMRNARP